MNTIAWAGVFILTWTIVASILGVMDRAAGGYKHTENEIALYIVISFILNFGLYGIYYIIRHHAY